MGQDPSSAVEPNLLFWVDPGISRMVLIVLITILAQVHAKISEPFGWILASRGQGLLDIPSNVSNAWSSVWSSGKPYKFDGPIATPWTEGRVS